jgi:hypothetical protein
MKRLDKGMRLTAVQSQRPVNQAQATILLFRLNIRFSCHGLILSDIALPQCRLGL